MSLEFINKIMFCCFQNLDTMTNIDPLKRYRLDKPIGSGGFAKVSSAIDTIANTSVAVKISKGSYPARTLKREFDLIEKMEHPNIIRPTDFYYIHDLFTTAHMVLPLMKKDLYTHAIDENRIMKTEDLRKLVVDIAGAIKYIHDKDIVHRDIKPENILIDASGNYVLCDFGHAEYSDSMKMIGLYGSLSYMAPEVAANRLECRSPFTIGKPIDIFSFGMVLYNIATRTMGGAIRGSKTDAAHLDDIARFDMIPFVDEMECDEMFKDLLMSMLIRHPVGRITIDEILRHPFISSL